MRINLLGIKSKAGRPLTLQKPDIHPMVVGTAVEASFVARKVKYKAFLVLLKCLPYLIMLMDWANTFLCMFGKEFAWLSYVGGTSYLVLLFMWVASFVFNFCSYHRVPLWYIFVNNSLVLYDTYIGLPLDNKELLDLNLVLVGGTIVLMTILYIREKRRWKV